MGQYITREDFDRRMNKEDLDTLIVKEEANLEEAIETAEGVINGYLSLVCETPLNISPIPGILVQAAFDISIYNLHSRVQFRDIPEFVRDKYEDALKMLTKISRGEIIIKEIPAEIKEDKVIMQSEARRTYR